MLRYQVDAVAMRIAAPSDVNTHELIKAFRQSILSVISFISLIHNWII